jgi:hypothetical protein
MEDADWRQLVSDINLDITGIIRAQRILDEVNAELGKRTARPIEEDFIHADAWGRDPGTPRVFDIDGVEIQTRMLHRRGIHQRDVKGADLLYEIAGKKFALIQYEAPDGRDLVRVDRTQLEELMAAYPNPCPPHARNLWPTCGAWYAVRSTSVSAYLPACKAHDLFEQAAARSMAYFAGGLPHEAFQQVFARCWTGARIAPVEMAYSAWALLEADRVLFTVLQRGNFGRW